MTREFIIHLWFYTATGSLLGFIGALISWWLK